MLHFYWQVMYLWQLKTQLQIYQNIIFPEILRSFCKLISKISLHILLITGVFSQHVKTSKFINLFAFVWDHHNFNFICNIVMIWNNLLISCFSIFLISCFFPWRFMFASFKFDDRCNKILNMWVTFYHQILAPICFWYHKIFYKMC